jgi:hypothetical protein
MFVGLVCGHRVFSVFLANTVLPSAQGLVSGYLVQRMSVQGMCLYFRLMAQL